MARLQILVQRRQCRGRARRRRRILRAENLPRRTLRSRIGPALSGIRPSARQGGRILPASPCCERSCESAPGVKGTFGPRLHQLPASTQLLVAMSLLDSFSFQIAEEPTDERTVFQKLGALHLFTALALVAALAVGALLRRRRQPPPPIAPAKRTDGDGLDWRHARIGRPNGPASRPDSTHFPAILWGRTFP